MRPANPENTMSLTEQIARIDQQRWENYKAPWFKKQGFLKEWASAIIGSISALGLLVFMTCTPTIFTTWEVMTLWVCRHALGF